MLRNFDTDLDILGVSRAVLTAKPVPEVIVTQRVTVTQQPSVARSFLLRGEADWSWSDLRDYVVEQIESRFGAFPRDAKKEAAIFKSFLTRHGVQSVGIARYAFEISDGYWAGAPIGVNRFCRGSDPFFAEPISARLVDSPVTGW